MAGDTSPATVRRLREAEIRRVVDELWVPFAREMAELDSYNELDDDAREGALAFRRDQFRTDDAATFVAERAGSLVGYAHVVYSEPPAVYARGAEGHINEVYVAPEHRGYGIAGDLLDRVERWAAERDCERISLSVNADNEIAKRLYESRGYATRRLKMDKRL